MDTKIQRCSNPLYKLEQICADRWSSASTDSRLQIQNRTAVYWKNPQASGSEQFKPMLFRGHLYFLSTLADDITRPFRKTAVIRVGVGRVWYEVHASWGYIVLQVFLLNRDSKSYIFLLFSAPHFCSGGRKQSQSIPGGSKCTLHFKKYITCVSCQEM